MSMILKDVLEIAIRACTEIGSPSPKSDAEHLLCYYFECDRAYISAHYRDSFDESRCQGFFDLLDRRVQGEPVQHITGSTEFMGLPFTTTPDALIPRPETELLTQAVLNDLQARKGHLGGLEVLDLCTGSGAIAISVAKLAAGNVKVTATDLSEDALNLAKCNAESLHTTGLKLMKGDLFSPFPTKELRRPDEAGFTTVGKHPFDVIVCNPPYIPSGVIPTLRTEVKDHEPLMALDGGACGLDFYVRIFSEAPLHLKSGGLLALEIGADQGEAILALCETSGAFLPAPPSLLPDCPPPTGSFIYQDYAGMDRIFLGIRK